MPTLLVDHDKVSVLKQTRFDYSANLVEVVRDLVVGKDLSPGRGNVLSHVSAARLELQFRRRNVARVCDLLFPSHNREIGFAVAA